MTDTHPSRVYNHERATDASTRTSRATDNGVIRGLFESFQFTALIDRKNRIIMDWSPKSGCTVCIKMFLKHMDLLDTALEYNRWIHKYRRHCFYKTHRVRLADLTDASYFRFKVVRNPYTRVVSSYIHTMKHGYSDARIKAVLNRNDADISFTQFIQYLSGINLHTCNPHYRQQKALFEYRFPTVFDRICKLEALRKEIERVNSLAKTRFSLNGLLKSGHHIKKSHAVAEPVFDVPWSALKAAIPDYRWFYNEGIAQQVYALYIDDFETYDYHSDKYLA